MRVTALAIFVSLLLAARPAPSRTYAIKDAMVVLAPLLELEKGTVVVRDGLIAEFGKDVDVPADAEVLDGKGLVVYPGFIDGRTALGLPDTKRASEALKLAEGEKPDFARDAL